MLTIIWEMSLAEYHQRKFPLWLAQIPGEELLWDFLCDDQECEGSNGARVVRVWRKMRKAA